MPIRLRVAALALAALTVTPLASAAADLVLKPVDVVDSKALFGKIESRFVVPSRSRIGGTLVQLDVSEGTTVTEGQVIGKIVDQKLELQLEAADARIRAAQSQLNNAQTELARNEELLARGATTTQRVDQARTAVDVAQNAVSELQSAQQVVQQQMDEGSLIAPTTGRVLSVPIRLGEVVMPGEPVATIAGGSVFLRLDVPERHALGLVEGASVTIAEGEGARQGRIEKIYPLIENGRVTVDVVVDGLSDTFIGKRVLVSIPVGTRPAIVVPQEAIRRSAGLDLVSIKVADGERAVTVVPGPVVDTPDGQMREILSGLRAGDTVILP